MGRTVPRWFSYRYTLLTAAVALLFLGPLMLKVYDRRWEPYPALILPGEGSVNTNDLTGYRHRLLYFYGRTSAGTWQRIPSGDLISPVRASYFGSLYRAGVFDQESVNRSTALAAWISGKLVEAGYAPSPLLVRDVLVKYDGPSGRPVTVDTLNERYLDLP